MPRVDRSSRTSRRLIDNGISRATGSPPPVLVYANNDEHAESNSTAGGAEDPRHWPQRFVLADHQLLGVAELNVTRDGAEPCDTANAQRQVAEERLARGVTRCGVGTVVHREGVVSADGDCIRKLDEAKKYGAHDTRLWRFS